MSSESKEQFRRALALREARFGPQHRDVIAAHDALGTVLIYAGEYAPDDSRTQEARERLRASYEATGQVQQAAAVIHP